MAAGATGSPWDYPLTSRFDEIDTMIVFDNVEIKTATGDPIVMDNATVKWNGTIKTGSSGGSPTPFY